MTPQEYIDHERWRVRTNLRWAQYGGDDETAQRLEEILQALDELERGLTPTVTGEKVEKAWKANVVERFDSYKNPFLACSRCGYNLDDYLEHPVNFCPECGSSISEEAVNVVMERLEAMKDSNIEKAPTITHPTENPNAAFNVMPVDFEGLKHELEHTKAELDKVIESLRGDCNSCAHYTDRHGQGKCRYCIYEHPNCRAYDCKMPKDYWEWAK